MKTARFLPFLLIPLLSACLSKKPEIYLPSIPAGPVLEALEQRRQSLYGLRATASLESVRGGRRRAFDNVGILLDDQRRVRLEAFSPLGQSLLTLIWDGPDVIIRLDDGRVIRPGLAGIERLLGMRFDSREICAVLTANVPVEVEPVETNAYREQDGSILIQMITSDGERRLHVASSEAQSNSVWITAAELYRSGKLVYRVRYGDLEAVSEYLLPQTVLVENPERKSSFKIVYDETDINVPLSKDAFVISDPETGIP